MQSNYFTLCLAESLVDLNYCLVTFINSIPQLQHLFKWVVITVTASCRLYNLLELVYLIFESSHDLTILIPLLLDLFVFFFKLIVWFGHKVAKFFPLFNFTGLSGAICSDWSVFRWYHHSSCWYNTLCQRVLGLKITLLNVHNTLLTRWSPIYLSLEVSVVWTRTLGIRFTFNNTLWLWYDTRGILWISWRASLHWKLLI